MLQHTTFDEKPFKCSQCDKSFAIKKLLKKHQHIHTSRYQCKFCSKKFGRLQHLQAHERIHTGEKPFKCEYDGCGQSFRKKYHLVRHKLTHEKSKSRQNNKAKRYSCNSCDKSFGTQSTLNQHKYIHTSKYQCRFCGTRERSPSHLKRHMKMHDCN